MSEQAKESAPSVAAPADQLRFSCHHCGLELSAPLAVAGVTAPCPGCGGTITAPSAAPRTEPPSAPHPSAGPGPESSPPGPAPPSEPVPAPRPEVRRDVVRQTVREPVRRTVQEPVRRTVQDPVPKPARARWADDAEAAPLPDQRVVRRRRKSPGKLASIESSMTPAEAQEMRIVIKVLLSILATALITWAVCKVVSNSIMNGPPPTDSRAFLKP